MRWRRDAAGAGAKVDGCRHAFVIFFKTKSIVCKKFLKKECAAPLAVRKFRRSRGGGEPCLERLNAMEPEFLPDRISPRAAAPPKQKKGAPHKGAPRGGERFFDEYVITAIPALVPIFNRWRRTVSSACPVTGATRLVLPGPAGPEMPDRYRSGALDPWPNRPQPPYPCFPAGMASVDWRIALHVLLRAGDEKAPRRPQTPGSSFASTRTGLLSR